MIAWILVQAGLDPTFIAGGVLHDLGTNARAGHGPHFVIEADEYDRAFLGLWPQVAVVTTIEHDHPDCYPTFDDMRDAFAGFAVRVRASGLLIVGGEDWEAQALGDTWRSIGGQAVTFGLGSGWDWQAEHVQVGMGVTFEVWHAGRRLGSCALGLPGQHNVLNALAALAAADAIGIPFEMGAGALAEFRGTARRFELKGEASGVTVVDDYAHHPTEIRATLAAARARYPGRSIWAVFQPHTYSRTAALLSEFGTAFGDANHVVVTGIYAARESHSLGMSGADVAAQIGQSGHPDVAYVETLAGVAAAVLERVGSGDVVLTLGAGDGYLVGEWVLSRLKCRGGGG